MPTVFAGRKQEAQMKISRSKLITRIIVFALLIYAGISLITLRGRIETIQGELYDVRREVAEIEISNSELEYKIENHDAPDVITDIARSELGLVMPGEIIFYDGGIGQYNAD